MNYYAARERKDKGGWAFTVQNDGHVWAASCCTTWPDGMPTTADILARKSTSPKPGPDHAHATAEEAERCFYDYEVAHLQKMTYTTADQCVVCGAWTPTALDSLHLGTVAMCDTHLSPENWSKARPFEPGIAITSSY